MNRRDFTKSAVLVSSMGTRKETETRMNPEWIHLTEVSGETVTIRKDSITSIGNDGEVCFLTTNRHDYYVKESYGEVLRKLGIIT